MAQREYSIDLQDTLFTMLSEQQGRTIIGTNAGEAPAKENKPGIAYCHNVMPSRYGMDSIGFLSVIPVATGLPAGTVFTDVRVVYGSAKSRLYLAWDSLGNVYATNLKDGTITWLALPATVPATGGSLFNSESVTIGTVNGVSHIFYSGIGSFTYNESTNVLDAETLTGLAISDILGVVGSSGYLVAYTTLAIAWSSTIDPTDFVPSQITGSGGGNVAGTAGAIIFVTYNTLGLLVYTAGNVLAGTYTGNVQFPFKFREVDDSKGGISLDRVAYENNSKLQYVYSKAGIQQINSQKAETVLPEVTDFLAGRRFEDYNEVTKLYEVTDLSATATMLKKIKFVAARYLIISYGITSFTHALIFDIVLNKLGKIRLTHVDVFEYIGTQSEISRESIAFVLSTGEVQILDFSTAATSSGVIILGKLQFSRTRFINLLGVEVENVETGSTLDVSSQASLDGKNFTTVQADLKDSATNIREYDFRTTAMNHSLVFIGKFNLVTVQVRYAISGRR